MTEANETTPKTSQAREAHKKPPRRPQEILERKVARFLNAPAGAVSKDKTCANAETRPTPSLGQIPSVHNGLAFFHARPRKPDRKPDQLHRFSNPHHVQFPVSNRLRRAQPVASKGTSRPWSQAGPAIGGRVLGSGGSGRAAEGDEGQSSLGGQHSPMHTEYSMHSRRRSSEEGGCWRQS